VWSRESVEAVYRRHSFAVFRRCMALLKDEAEAQDVSHDVFLELLAQPESYRGAASKTTYLYAVATHKCLNRLRHHRFRDSTWEAAVGVHLESQGDRGGEAILGAREVITRIFEAADERTALIGIYHFVDGLPQTEIARLVGLSRLTVNQRVQQLRASGKAVEADDSPRQ
jgi:RNA polymerase sigma-70 factor (ECF subfamily)